MSRKWEGKISITYAVALLLILASVLASPLSVSTNKSQYRPGETVKITINGKANTAYGVEVRDPQNKIVFLKQVTTGSNGVGTTQFKLSSSAREGTYKVYVSGGGESASKTFKVAKEAPPPSPPSKKSSSIKLNINATVLEPGQFLRVSGQLTPKIKGAKIILIYTSPTGSRTYRNVNTMDNGVFEDVFKPEELGKWTVEAKWLGNSEYKGSSSKKEFWVKQRLEVTLTVYPSEAPLNSEIVLTGSVKPQLANVRVVLQYSLDGSFWQDIGETTTGADGSFGFTYTVAVTGVLKFRAVVPETDTILESVSSIVEVRVVRELKASIGVEVEPQELMPGEEVLIKASLNVSVTGRAIISAYYGAEEIPIAELELVEAQSFDYTWTPEREGVYVIVVKVIPEYGSPLVAFSMVNVRVPFFTFTLTLKTEEGMGVEGVFVRVYSDGEMVAYGQSDAEGRVSFVLKGGVYRLVFVYVGREVGEAEYEVKSDLEEEVVLPLVALEFTVKDALGNPLAGVPVSAVDEYGVRYAAITDPEGRAFLIVPKGRLKVISGGVEKELAAERRQSIELTVQTGYRIEHLALSLAVGVAIGVAVGAALIKYMATRRKIGK